jgi:hypothetical protein
MDIKDIQQKIEEITGTPLDKCRSSLRFCHKSIESAKSRLEFYMGSKRIVLDSYTFTGRELMKISEVIPIKELAFFCEKLNSQTADCYMSPNFFVSDEIIIDFTDIDYLTISLDEVLVVRKGIPADSAKAIRMPIETIEKLKKAFKSYLTKLNK